MNTLLKNTIYLDMPQQMAKFRGYDKQMMTLMKRMMLPTSLQSRNSTTLECKVHIEATTAAQEYLEEIVCNAVIQERGSSTDRKTAMTTMSIMVVLLASRCLRSRLSLVKPKIDIRLKQILGEALSEDIFVFLQRDFYLGLNILRFLHPFK